MKITIKNLFYLLSLVTCASSHAEDVYVPIDKSQSGNLYVDAVINSSVHSPFMVDTGAGMITLNRDLFEEVSRAGKVVQVGEVVAKLANNSFETMPLYKVESFSIGDNCNLGEIEVAVMKNAERNILGLSALIMVAPFSIHTSPLELVLSGCSSSDKAISSNQAQDTTNSI